MKKNILKYNIYIIQFLIVLNSVQAAEWSGKVAMEYKAFTESALDNRQHGNNVSIFAEPEFFHEWQDSQSLTVKVFSRWDEGDDERNHSDIREFLWQKVADDWEIKAGIGKVYWGVTESQHLVDIVNQTDLVESYDREEKLGQALINLSLIQSWGNIDLYILPGFRERTYPGIKGRLRSSPVVDTSQAAYESKDDDKHIDYALRLFHSVDEWDIGLSVFNGTSRDPRFLIGFDKKNQIVLKPFYDLIIQTGLDVQGTFDSWLWKMEWIHRSGQGASYNASTAGLEYTFYGILGSDTDLGLILEYLYDDRGSKAPTPFENDVLLGTRFVFNNAQSTDLLVGLLSDLDNINPSLSVEASHRLNDNLKLNAEAQIFKETSSSDPINAFRKDDYVQIELEYFF